MKELVKENFDEIVHSGKTLILLFYNQNEGGSTLALEQFGRIDEMIGKNFELYTVCAAEQREICHACSNHHTPEFISIKNTKIHKRLEGVVFTNQILDLLK